MNDKKLRNLRLRRQAVAFLLYGMVVSGELFHRGLAQHKEGDTGHHDGECKATKYALVRADAVRETEEEQEGTFDLFVDVNAGKCKVNQRKSEEEEARYTAAYQRFLKSAHLII